MKELTVARHYINYFLPREVLGPVILVFSIENVVDRLFQLYFPGQFEIYGWLTIALLAALVVYEWGESDEDFEGLEEDIEEIIEDD